jgi:hypothetical protein
MSLPWHDQPDIRGLGSSRCLMKPRRDAASFASSARRSSCDRPESAVDDASRFQFAPAFRIHPGGDSESRLACFVAGAINFEFRDRFFAWGSPSQDVLAVAFGVSKDLVSLCFSVRIELIGGEGGYERVARLQPALAAGPTPALPGNFPHRWVPMMTSSAGAPR